MADPRAALVDSLVMQLNKRTGLCYHPVMIYSVNKGYVDLWLHESKFIFSMAMRLNVQADGKTLGPAKTLNFEPSARLQTPSLRENILSLAEAVVTPELVGRGLRQNETIVPVPAQTDFGYAPAKPSTGGFIAAYAHFADTVADNGQRYAPAR